MRPFDYTRPESLDDALLRLAGSGGEARPLAGGTDLLTLMKAGLNAPSRLLDLKRLDELSAGVDLADDGGVRLGALLTLAAIERDPRLGARYPLLAQAAGSAATPQLRNRATLGGNLLQRPRCWYFRDPQIGCWLKGGDDCPARDGLNQHHALFETGPCRAVHPSDLAGALLALDAAAVVRDARGERRVALAELFAAPESARRRETTLGDDELLTAVDVPAAPAGARGVYLKAMERKAWAFALVGVAALVAPGHVRLVANGVAATPWRLRAAEDALADGALDAADIDRAAAAAPADAEPLAHNGYKIALLQGLVKQALTALQPSAKE